VDFDYAERRARLARTLHLTDEILIVGAGNLLPKPELSEQMLPFIAHQEYYYLTGNAGAVGGIIAFDPQVRIVQACTGITRQAVVGGMPSPREFRSRGRCLAK
jgi:hypothetical protein